MLYQLPRCLDELYGRFHLKGYCLINFSIYWWYFHLLCSLFFVNGFQKLFKIGVKVNEDYN